MARKPRQPQTRRPARPRPRKRWGVVVGALAGLAVVVGGVAVVVVLRGREAPAPVEPAQVQPEVVAAVRPLQPAPKPAGVVTFEEGCASAECHGPMGDRGHAHQTFTEEACDRCHGPDTGGHVFPQLAPTGEACGSCHASDAGHAFEHRAMTDEGCLACHDPHGSASPALLVGATVAETCTRCHPADRAREGHGPYTQGDCGACHDPHGADNAALLHGGPAPENCRLCHGQTVTLTETAEDTHAGVEGSCLGCHEAHAAQQPGLLAARPRELCVSCHEDVGAEVAGAMVSHEAVLKGRQCVTCHDPHASSHGAMLRNEQQAVCLSCHTDPVETAEGREVRAIGPELAAASVVHGAVTLGGCSSCHSMHGAEHAALLRSVDPAVLVGPYDERHFALCFSCHDTRLADLPGASQFRDGQVNLHGVHLRAGDGSGGCSDCHAVHAGTQARLVVEQVRYQGSDWETPMNFTITPAGGSCAPSCHEAASYSRQPGGAAAGKTQGGSP